MINGLTTSYTYTDVAFWAMVVGGLGLFLFGITMLSSTIKKMAGNNLKKIISKATGNPVKGVVVGAGFTAVIQSSSGTTALVIGLVRAGVMTLPQAVAVIIGANIGTTITVFLISIPFAQYVPFVLFIGSMIIMLSSKRKLKNFGELLFAFGAVFFGLWIMEQNLSSLAQEQWFSDMLAGLNGMPWLGLLIGTLATVALQSSSAVIGVLQGIYAAAASDVTLFGILPILFGANVGTTITAILSSVGGSAESKRTAFIHVLFNISGALVFMILLYPCEGWLNTSPSWSLDPKLQIALAHMVFNVGTAALILPFIKPLCALSVKVFKGSTAAGPEIVIRELDSNVLREFPATGVGMVKDLSIDMFEYVLTMFETIGKYLDKPNDEYEEYVEQLEESTDKIDRQLNEYMIQVDPGDLAPADMKRHNQVLRAIKDIERIGDYGENLIHFYANAKERKETFYPESLKEILSAQGWAVSTIKKTMGLYKSEDVNDAIEVIQSRRDYITNLEEFGNNHFDRVSKDKELAKQYLSLVYIDILNSYERVLSHCSNIAKLYGTDKPNDFTPPKNTTSDDERFKNM